MRIGIDHARHGLHRSDLEGILAITGNIVERDGDAAQALIAKSA